MTIPTENITNDTTNEQPPLTPADLQGGDYCVGGSRAGNAEDFWGDVKSGWVIIDVIDYDHHVRCVAQCCKQTNKQNPKIN